MIPSVSEDFADLFEKSAANRLPNHEPYNLAIPLMDGTSRPNGPIHGLSEPELKALLSRRPTFGLTNAPASFRSPASDTHREFLEICAVTYLDDILTYSDSEADHARHARATFENLRVANLFVELEKCEFHVQRTVFLVFCNSYRYNVGTKIILSNPNNEVQEELVIETGVSIVPQHSCISAP